MEMEMAGAWSPMTTCTANRVASYDENTNMNDFRNPTPLPSVTVTGSLNVPTNDVGPVLLQ